MGLHEQSPAVGYAIATADTFERKLRAVESEASTKSPPAAIQIRQQRPNEGTDDYPVVVTIDAKTRVVECAAGIQWFIQKRVRAGGRYPWRSVYFCRTKAGLLLYAESITTELLALPDRFPEGAAS